MRVIVRDVVSNGLRDMLNIRWRVTALRGWSNEQQTAGRKITRDSRIPGNIRQSDIAMFGSCCATLKFQSSSLSHTQKRATILQNDAAFLSLGKHH